MRTGNQYHSGQMNTKEIKRLIRAKFAWPGGYEIYLVTDDGGVLCCECARKEYRQILYSRWNSIRDGWNVVGYGTADQHDGLLTCDHCNKVIVEEVNHE